MYNYFFYMMIKLRQAQKHDHDAIFDGAGMVFVLISIHSLILLTLIREVFGIQHLNHPSINALPYMLRKLVYLPFALTFFILVYRYYKKNYGRIVDLYSVKYPAFNHWQGFAHYCVVLVISTAAFLGLVKIFG